MLWRRRWIVAGVTWLVCLAGWALVPFQPDVYRSSARIYVDTESLLGPLLRGLTVQIDPRKEIEFMKRTLKSRPNLETVARMTDLDLMVDGPTGMEKLVSQLRRRITIRSETENLFTISFKHPDPVMARRVVQSLLTIYVEGNLGTNRKDINNARNFLDDQIRGYEQQLEASEQRLAKFKQANMGVMPGNTGYYQRLEQRRGALTAAQSKLENALAVRQELKRQLANVAEYHNTNSPGSSSGPPSNLQIRILQLEQEIDILMVRFTPRHPDVVSAQRRLDLVQKELEADLRGPGPGAQESSADSAGKVSNPVYEQIKLRLVASEAAIVALRGDAKRAETNVIKMERLANRVPAVEAELTRLNRDYSIIKRNFEQLLSRREAAKMSESREIKNEKALFRIVDPPKLPRIATGPPRLLMLSAVLIIGLGAGIGFGAVLANLRPAFLTARRLKQAFALPVLGSVSIVRSSAEKTWGMVKLAMFALAFVGLFGTYGGLMAAESTVGLQNIVSKEMTSKVKRKLDEYLSGVTF